MIRVVFKLPLGDLVLSEPGYDQPWPLVIGISNLRQSVKAGHLQGLFNGEATSLEVKLANSKNEAARLLDTPLRVDTEVYDGEVLWFKGLVQSIAYGRTMALTLEA